MDAGLSLIGSEFVHDLDNNSKNPAIVHPRINPAFPILKLFCDCSLVLTSTGPGRFMVLVVLCPGAPEGSTDSGSGLKCLRRRESQLSVSSNRLGEPGIKLGTR